jgi:hypothetical protein
LGVREWCCRHQWRQYRSLAFFLERELLIVFVSVDAQQIGQALLSGGEELASG